MKKKGIYIVLVNFNGASDTIECVNSILDAHQVYDVKIIVVDNASAEDDKKILKNDCSKFILIELEENLGFAGGNNIGIKKASDMGAEYVMLLNNDTIIDPCFFDVICPKLSENYVLTTKILLYNDRQVLWYAGGIIDRYRGNSYHMHMGEQIGNSTQDEYVTFASGCCMLLPQTVIDKVGLLDESYFMYYEDTDYCIRIQENGFRIKYLSDAIVYHKVSASTGGDETSFNLYYMSRNRLLCISKNKRYFKKVAIIFSIVTRYIYAIRMIIKGQKNWKSIIVAINAYKNGEQGKADKIY